MADEQENTAEWKKAMKDANAVGWVLFFLLVIGVGVGTIYFGSVDTPETASTSQATQ